ncbi:SRPBCC family protein [Nonomuraea sp. NPDC003804]|uniref:SRPBCC family protein n=1 Tax=Nonomuraea sp. NPDC003804 TaxID=3154547 RepID=UPI0033ABC2E5
MIDIARQITAIGREVARQPAAGGETVTVRLRRTYDAAVEDVWDALTDPDRIKRWFMPISGELRVGGTFQLEGNAGGEILTCEPPHAFRVTFGGETSVVEVRLAADGPGATVLEMKHTVPIEIAGSGAGALYVGPGWDGAVLGLSLYLSGQTAGGDPVAAAHSPEALAFSKESVLAWVTAVEKSGTATEEEVAAAQEVSLSQFAPGH